MTEPRLIDPAELCGVTEIAVMARVGRSAVSNWTARYPDFPAPVTELACGKLYLRPEIDTWLRTPRTVQRVMPPRLR